MSAPIIAVTMATDSLQHLNVATLSDSLRNLKASNRSNVGLSADDSVDGIAEEDEEEAAEVGDAVPSPPRPRKFSSLSPAFSFSRFGSLKQLTRQV